MLIRTLKTQAMKELTETNGCLMCDGNANNKRQKKNHTKASIKLLKYCLDKNTMKLQSRKD